MQYKLNDRCYLGCRKDRIANATPVLNPDIFYRLVYWIKERSKIHIQKDIEHKPAPWTNDPVLSQVRFTNVRRELDRETKNVISRVCMADISFESKIANICLFRMLNKLESLDGILPIDFDDAEYNNKVFQWISSLPPDFKPFSRAFMVSGMMSSVNAKIGKRNSQIQSCADYCKWLWDTRFFHTVSLKTNARDIYEYFKTVPGLGSFLAYQIFVDITYCPECTVSENEFVVAGPGCKEGLKLLFQKRAGLSPEELLFWLRDNWNSLCNEYNIEWDVDEIFPDIPEQDRYMNVMSLQNCFCELSKYHRAWYGGFIKNKYIPREEQK